jgi:hypothetical protein
MTGAEPAIIAAVAPEVIAGATAAGTAAAGTAAGLGAGAAAGLGGGTAGLFGAGTSALAPTTASIIAPAAAAAAPVAGMGGGTAAMFGAGTAGVSPLAAELASVPAAAGGLNTTALQGLLKGASDLAESAVRGWIKLNPEDAKAQLTAGKWNDLVSGDVKKQLFHESDMAINAKRIEEERRQKEIEKALEAKKEQTRNDFLVQMEKGSLSAKDILGSNLDAFGSGSKHTFLEMLKASGDSKLRTDPAAFIDAFKRIHLPDDDPKKLRDEEDLNQLLIGRKVTFEDLNKLRGEFQGRKTTEGQIEAELKKNVIKMAESSLTRTNPLMGIRDPQGDEQMQKFLTYFLTEFENQKKKGKNARDLLDPGSPDYLGKSVAQFARSPQQIMKDMAKMATSSSTDGGLQSTPGVSPSPDASPSALPSPGPSGDRARKPGESIQEYMKRVGK